MIFKNKHLLWIFALLTAIGFDQLFWERGFGINFFILITLATLGGLIPFWLEKIHIPWTSYLLLIPAAFFSAMTFIRAEPSTTALNGLLTVSAVGLFFMTLQNGSWYQYRIRDHLFTWFHFLMNSIIGGIVFFTKVKKTEPSLTSDQVSGDAKTKDPDDEQERISKKPGSNSFLRKIAPYLRGLLLALPILAIMAFLLGQADPIFNDRLQNFFSQFRIENLGETIFRSFYVLVIGYVLLSAYTFALLESKKYEVKEDDKLAVKPFLGSIESNIILGTVNLLFLTFVILQFNYLFSGGRNISAEGYTYAEYARRGFFELIAVAVISLFLFYILSVITKREGKKQGWGFSALGLTLVGLVALILVSAYTRLNLYELAYGFTRLRTLAHIFMIWIGLLLIAVAVLEVTKNIQKLAFILICFILGFGITLNILNIDQFIVRHNVSRVIAGEHETLETDLDAGYLTTLSHDAVPKLVEFFNDPEIPEDIRNEIGSVLACKSAMNEEQKEYTWVAYNTSRQQALALLESLENALEKFPVSYDMYTWFVEVNGEVRSCTGYGPEIYD
jgi:hypothetical protein